jgi:hypothetical protein
MKRSSKKSSETIPRTRNDYPKFDSEVKHCIKQLEQSGDDGNTRVIGYTPEDAWNPTMQAITEVRRIHPTSPIICVSIGVGLQEPKPPSKVSPKWFSFLSGLSGPRFAGSLTRSKGPDVVGDYCRSHLVGSDKVHQAVVVELDGIVGQVKYGQVKYYRFNVMKDLSEIGLGDLSKVGDISDLTESYMEQGESIEMTVRVSTSLEGTEGTV